MLKWVVAHLVLRPEIEFAQRQADAGADETGRVAIEIFPPPPFGIEDRAVVGAGYLIEEDVPFGDRFE